MHILSLLVLVLAVELCCPYLIQPNTSDLYPGVHTWCDTADLMAVMWSQMLQQTSHVLYSRVWAPASSAFSRNYRNRTSAQSSLRTVCAGSRESCRFDWNSCREAAREWGTTVRGRPCPRRGQSQTEVSPEGRWRHCASSTCTLSTTSICTTYNVSTLCVLYPYIL